jgi:hypothetical protein
MMDDDKLDEALRRLRDSVVIACWPDEPPLGKAAMLTIARDLEIVLEALARYRFGPPWLVRTLDGKFRVKWRDVEGVIQDRAFDTRAL